MRCWAGGILPQPAITRGHFLVDTLELGLVEFGGGLEIDGHAPWQQFLDPSERMVGDAGYHFAQPAFRIDAWTTRRFAENYVD
jgi:hypothetical protein